MIRKFFPLTTKEATGGGETIQFATFDGSNDYISVPSISQSFVNGFIIEGWFRFPEITSLFTGLFELNNISGNASIGVQTLTDDLDKDITMYAHKESGTKSSRGTANYLITGWHYYKMEINTTTDYIHFYRDEVLLDSQFISNMDIKNSVRDNNRIGNRPGDSRYMPMDAREIIISNSLGQVINYPLYNDLTDISGNNLHGTNMGGITFNSEPI